MNRNFHVIIPARYESSRLPGKLLMDIAGHTILERVYCQAQKANPASIVIATDNILIADHAHELGATVVMTSPHHQSGTERIAEAVGLGEYKNSDVIVNVQGDEPFINPALIKQVANDLLNADTSMSTLCWPITSSELFHNPNIVKVVRDSQKNALYFSRSPIPFNRDNEASFSNVYRHIGLYAYRANFLLDMVSWPVCELEACEKLEQIRVLWMGHRIHVEQACIEPLQDVNNHEDLLLARAFALSS